MVSFSLFMRSYYCHRARLRVNLGKDLGNILGKVCARNTYDNQRVRYKFRQSGNWVLILRFLQLEKSLCRFFLV